VEEFPPNGGCSLNSSRSLTTRVNFELTPTPLLISVVPVASDSAASRSSFPARPVFRQPCGGDLSQAASPSSIESHYTRVLSLRDRPRGSSERDTLGRSAHARCSGAALTSGRDTHSPCRLRNRDAQTAAPKPLEFAQRRALLPVHQVDRAPDKRPLLGMEADRRRPDYARHRRRRYRSRVVGVSARVAFRIPQFKAGKHHTQQQEHESLTAF
jgi:hypothetical protein